MDISLREWLVIGGVIVIALIIFDGWRRVRGGRDSLRMDIDRRFRDLPDEPEEQQSNPELPYGGARVAGDATDAALARDAAEPAPRRAPMRESRERIEPTFGSARDDAPREDFESPAFAPEAVPAARGEVDPSLNLGAQVDDFDDYEDDLGRPRRASAEPKVQARAQAAAEAPVKTAEPGQQPGAAETPRGPFARKPLEEVDPLFDEVPDDYSFHEPSVPHEPSQDETVQPKPAAVAPPPAAEPETPAFDLEKPVPMLMERARKPRGAVAPESVSAPQPETPKAPDAAAGQEAPARPRPVPAAQPAAAEKPQQDSLFNEAESATPSEPAAAADETFELPDPEHVLVITVVSSAPEGFPGAGLNRILTACDLRLGSMRIFHRHEDGSDSGPVQFSMANAVNPGTFDPATIDSMHTPGVSFFMSMEQPRDVMNAFECMLATAETLARHLNGDLLDENRSVLRPQTKEHYRQRIRDFEMHNRSRRSASRA
ncbi:hypothetical protein GCM10011348_32850 [Marinobacterium nitratireducens]|uniref:Cell division protein ZipA n=1 Tax=Marinobacterium nitratireducens TaxID=518897 RepID=A0A918DVY7_9GAMM|nr:cell division protein ZipA [Marinobacterium nitratireducens]GGO85094.1 hypothetical protein GCM10011348_32850 [Marinobacterium nitratireducens]